MKKTMFLSAVIAVLLVSVQSVTSAHLSRIESVEPKKTATVTQQPVKKEPAANPVVVPAPQPVVDPNGCEAKGMWWRADNYACVAKPVPVQYVPPQSVIYSAAPTVGVEQWRALVAQYFPGEVDYTLRIMQCESSGNTLADSPTNDHGLMQINYPAHANKVASINQLYDPNFNLKLAKEIRDGSGWGAWSCSRKI